MKIGDETVAMAVDIAAMIALTELAETKRAEEFNAMLYAGVSRPVNPQIKWEDAGQW